MNMPRLGSNSASFHLGQAPNQLGSCSRRTHNTVPLVVSCVSRLELLQALLAQYFRGFKVQPRLENGSGSIFNPTKPESGHGPLLQHVRSGPNEQIS